MLENAREWDFLTIMPYLAISASTELPEPRRRALLMEASKEIAAATGKPEQYVMVKYQGGLALAFAGSDAPAAFLEVKSIGFANGAVAKLAQSLCGLVMKHLGVPANRTYIVFQDVAPSMWGFDGGTFG